MADQTEDMPLQSLLPEFLFDASGGDRARCLDPFDTTIDGGSNVVLRPPELR